MTALLPSDAKLEATAYRATDDWETKPAAAESMLFDLSTSSGDAKRQEFLHVLQVAETPATPLSFKQGQGDELVGASLGGVAVAFATRRDTPKAEFSVPGATKRIFIAGLRPSAGFKLSAIAQGDKLRVSVEPGGGTTSDAAGVLRFEPP